MTEFHINRGNRFQFYPVLTLLLLILILTQSFHLYARQVPQQSFGSDNLLQHFDELMPVIENKLLESLQEISFDSSLHPSYTERETGSWVATGEYEWTSGFFSGMLWQLFELTGKNRWRDHALLWTKNLDPVKNYKGDHDTGFRIMPGYGKGYILTDNLQYLQVIRKAAGTLSTRYSPNLGVIRSWDWTPPDIHWNYPVIIDNMMNLELLFEAARRSNDHNLYEIARRHAFTTLENHFRDDGSIYHIVDYADDGSVQWKGSVQGYSNDSVWARGQSWAIYGFVMAYRYTGEQAFLEASESAAVYFIDNLPDDGIPFYDFLDPSIPDTPRDVSAAAIAASAFVELYEFTGKDLYLNVSELMLNSMSRPPYFDLDGNYSSLLRQGARQKGDSDRGLIYADYYFMESWTRYLKLNNRQFPELDILHFNYLGQNYPNPFRTSTAIPYTIQVDGQVQIRLYDISGRFVRTLINSYQTAGSYILPVTLSGLATGVYLYELATSQESIRKKMLIVR